MIPPGHDLAANEPMTVCARCGKEGAWVRMGKLAGRYHVRCGFEAEYVRQMAEKGQLIAEIPEAVARKWERYIRRMKRVFGRD